MLRYLRHPARRPLRLYLLGQALIFIGAGLIEPTGSLLPMALCGSAALLLTWPLVRELATRRRRPSREPAQDERHEDA